jgi:hypothetical protein
MNIFAIHLHQVLHLRVNSIVDVLVLSLDTAMVSFY